MLAPRETYVHTVLNINSENEILKKLLPQLFIILLTFWQTFRAGASADQQNCTGLLTTVHNTALYICWQVWRGVGGSMLWLRKFWDNFRLRNQHLGSHDGSGLMAVDIHCRILGRTLCSNGRSDWLLHRFDVRLYEDRRRSLALQSGGKEQSGSDRKEHMNTAEW